jgi:hypothetical protein
MEDHRAQDGAYQMADQDGAAMTTMIEQVGLAIMAALKREGVFVQGEMMDCLVDGGLFDMRLVAQRAIEAMREPTREMLEQAGGNLSADRFTGIGMARSAWVDMIDEALKP